MNPIGKLQEYAVQHKLSLPVYTVVEEKNGTHQNYFRIRVECRGVRAFGDGPKKQTAKMNAASNLIKELDIPTVMEITSPGTPGKSYVNELQELVVNKGQLPEYVCTGRSGPAHKPEFTIECRYKDSITVAYNNNKKDAKNEAARLMVNKLKELLAPLEGDIEMNIENTTENLKELLLTEEEPNVMKIKQEAEKNFKTEQHSEEIIEENNYSEDEIKEKYMSLANSKLRNSNRMHNSNNKTTQTFAEYHKSLQKQYPVNLRARVISNFKNTLNSNDNMILEKSLKTNLGLLNINYTVKDIIPYAKFSNQIFLSSIRLETDPVILEIQSGESRERANFAVRQQMIKTLIQIL